LKVRWKEDMSTEEQIKLLVEIQKLDSRIYILQKELANQPVLIKNLEDEFKQRETASKTADEELKTLAVKRKEQEGDLAAKEEGIKKLQVQLYQLKTNKEYQAMEKEIGGHKADASVLEEGIIKTLEEIDVCTKKSAGQKEVLQQERQKIAGEKSKIDARIKEIESSLRALNSERTGVTQKIEKEFLEKYERILKSKEGIAMVPVQGDACGGCNINLPPQVINEIKLRHELIFCGSCARILYITEGN